MKIREVFLQVSENGDLHIPPELIQEMGLSPADPVCLAYLTRDGVKNDYQEFLLSPESIEAGEDEEKLLIPSPLLEQANLSPGEDKFSIGCMADGRLVGVAIVGRPVSRYLDNGLTLEVNRLCTDGTKNACSFLYAAAWRAARAMGYRKIVTYILDTESGASLRAAGWKCAGLAGGKRWTGSRRPAADLYPAQMKYRYEQSIDERSF